MGVLVVEVSNVRREHVESTRHHDELMTEERRQNAANLARVTEEFRVEMEALRNQSTRLVSEREGDEGSRKKAKGDSCKTPNQNRGNDLDSDHDPSGARGGNQGGNPGARGGIQGNPSGSHSYQWGHKESGENRHGDEGSHRKEKGGGVKRMKALGLNEGMFP